MDNKTSEEEYSAGSKAYHFDVSTKHNFMKCLDDFIYPLKLNYRLLKKFLRKYINSKLDKNFTNIIYVTASCPNYVPNSDNSESPADYIYEMRKQYPDTNICLLIPILGLSNDVKISKKFKLDFENKFFELERTSVSIDFFAQNKKWEAILYKFNKNEDNITVYGIYSTAFSYLKNPEELQTFEKSVMFMKAVREIAKNLYKENLRPDIIHSRFLPFFLGAEFEPKFPAGIKILQIFENFAGMEKQKQEPFWSLINIADKLTLQRICTDSYIQECLCKLFNLSYPNKLSKMLDCISLIYENYKLFHNTESKEYKNHGDIIFRRLNNRILKIFPNLFLKGDEYFYPFVNTLIKCDYWSVYSETYYKDLRDKKLASPSIINEIEKTADKSGFLYPMININNYYLESNTRKYISINSENYRETRLQNKKKLIKEFGSDSLKTNFIDETLFKNFDNVKIYGYLDSFYDAPLLFSNSEAEIFEEGIDILFGSLLKLFERNRNIQIIISIKDGMKNNYIKSVVNFLQDNKICMGRWVYVDGEMNLPAVFSSADMFLHPARFSEKSVKHLLGLHSGCIPVVSNSGILNDTVIDIFDNLSEGNGFKTQQSLLCEDENTNVYINVLEKALELYNNNPSSWNIIVKNALSEDVDRNFSILELYDRIYEKML